MVAFKKRLRSTGLHELTIALTTDLMQQRRSNWRGEKSKEKDRNLSRHGEEEEENVIPINKRNRNVREISFSNNIFLIA